MEPRRSITVEALNRYGVSERQSHRHGLRHANFGLVEQLLDRVLKLLFRRPACKHGRLALLEAAL